jgi:hypothetical protein
MYEDESLVSTHHMPDPVTNPVTALWFGRYGREDNALITITKSGMLDVKVRRGLVLRRRKRGGNLDYDLGRELGA